ncbi:hypothetical protein Raf01_24910 [Rugosimonospora africana]|uniref:Uncharacterized protein n=1 Tax=Rugosimonospora africana TaxID=556532 RepID=A0A8J3VPP5_9ACTN|nr:hypothetical protein Raf01_24910 [Rugosimonospora africana]
MPVVAVLVTMAAVLAATVAFGIGAGAAQASGGAGEATTRQSAAVGPQEEPQPVQTVKDLCHNCLGADDAICWELPPYECAVSVTIGWVAKNDVVVRFGTVDQSARAGIDYLPVKDGVITVPAGSQRGTGVVRLVPGKPTDQDRSFLIQLYQPSEGEISQELGQVTISAGEPGQPVDPKG